MHCGAKRNGVVDQQVCFLDKATFYIASSITVYSETFRDVYIFILHRYGMTA